MKTRVITVPQNKKAMIALDFDEAKDEDLIQFSLNEVEFKKLWDYNFFMTINNLVDVNIDDYEDENILDNKKLKKIIESNVFDNPIYDDEILPTIINIKNLFFEALNRQTGVFFFF